MKFALKMMKNKTFPFFPWIPSLRQYLFYENSKSFTLSPIFFEDLVPLKLNKKTGGRVLRPLLECY